MSIASFVADPLSYTKGHIVQFSHQAAKLSPAATGMRVQATMNNWGGDWDAEEYCQMPNRYTGFEFEEGFSAQTDTRNRIGNGCGHMHSVIGRVVNADLGIRYLPWKENCVTYMALDANARTFFTGPLSGCCIYMGQAVDGTWYAFHANRNNSGGSNNSAIKASMTTNVITRMGVSVRIKKFAIYGRHYSDFGFVFGQKKRGTWLFYAADTALGSKVGKFSTKVTAL